MFQSASPDVADAICETRSTDGAAVRIFAHATERLGLIEVRQGRPLRIVLLAPPFAGKVTEEAGAGKMSVGDLASLR